MQKEVVRDVEEPYVRDTPPRPVRRLFDDIYSSRILSSSHRTHYHHEQGRDNAGIPLLVTIPGPVRSCQERAPLLQAAGLSWLQIPCRLLPAVATDGLVPDAQCHPGTIRHFEPLPGPCPLDTASMVKLFGLYSAQNLATTWPQTQACSMADIRQEITIA